MTFARQHLLSRRRTALVSPMSRRRSRWSVEVWKLIDRSNLQIKDLEPLCAAGHHRLSLLEGGRVAHCEKARFVAELDQASSFLGRLPLRAE